MEMARSVGKSRRIKERTVNGIRILSDLDVDNMLTVASKTRYPIRNRAIILLGTDAGLTPREMSFLKRYHVYGDDDLLGEAIDLRAKPGVYLTSRVIPMAREGRLWNALHSLLENAPAVPGDPLIISERAVDGGGATKDPGSKPLRAMRRDSISYVYWKIMEKAGIANASALTARATFIVRACRQATEDRLSLRSVQEMTGLRSLESVQRLLESSQSDQETIIRDLFGN
ncbi:site-specific integrase [Salipiger mucosus]|uniref:Tyr recombinase domain-containing protein n=1 Tax=Salipiger mucosus DSM 16094 TaxID=1123237 RepID=S9S007_9RHOB|nr:site-specific integrase [Salipiger mucosus]EPX83550.1 hypothetical protein Salmuc_02158 [Salipiger mucosus DSM 16094]